MSCEQVKIISEVVHFARSIVLGYHSIPKIKWGSFRGRREEKWGSFRGRFGDHFRVGDHFGVGIISGAVQFQGTQRHIPPPKKNSLSIPPPPLPGSILAICIVSSALSRVRCSQCSVKFFCLTVNLTVNSFNDRLSYNDNSQVHWNCNTTVGPRSRFLVCSGVC